jgi:hypothetical protein
VRFLVVLRRVWGGGELEDSGEAWNARSIVAGIGAKQKEEMRTVKEKGKTAGKY